MSPPQPPQPRKPKSGRRQFAQNPGSERDWARVMKDPKVQQALQDPGIRQALYHNLQGTVPGGLSSIIPPEPNDSTPPLRMQGGGLSIQEQIDTLRKLAQQEPDITKKNQLLAKVTQLEASQMSHASSEPSSPVSFGGATIGGGTMSNLAKMGATGPATMGNTLAAMGAGALGGAGSTRQPGLSALVGAGTAGLLNYLIRRAANQKKKRSGDNPTQAQEPPDGTLPKSPTASTGATAPPAPAAPSNSYGPVGGPVPSVPGLPNIGALPPSIATPGPDLGGGPPGGLIMGTANSDSGNVISTDGGKTWKDQRTGKPWTDGLVANQTPISGSSLADATKATTPPPPAQTGLGSADTGSTPPPQANALGPDFMKDQQTRLDTGLIPRGPAGAYAPGWDEKLGKNTGAGDDSFMDPYYDASDDYEMAEGGPVPSPKKGVLLRKPHGLAAIPVLHTTIVITPTKSKAEKKPPAKKKTGGVIKPAKPNLIPPEHGPTPYGERPKKHGRVQVPRGFGAAIKGKRFGGIF